ncbi:hypothetical protein BDW71DRAFT_206791 [Aspergillus fruticulosus]
MELLVYPGTVSVKQLEIFWRVTDKARLAGLVGHVSKTRPRRIPLSPFPSPDHLPDALLVRVQQSDSAKPVAGRLIIEQDLTITVKMQYPKPKQHHAKYQLYSIIFTYDKNAVIAVNDKKIMCVRGHGAYGQMGPGQRWVLSTDLTLAVLLTAMKSNQRPSLLAYGRLPLNGPPPKKMGVLMRQEIDLNSSSGEMGV